MKKTVATALLVLFAAGPAFSAEDMARWKGRKAVSALTDDLQKRVAATMKESGPRDAIAVCAYQAEAIKGDVAKKEGITAKRTSLKIRNPKNAPDDYEKEVLERYAALSLEGRLPEDQVEFRKTDAGGVYRFTSPIVAEDRCLACHGTNDRMAEDVRTMLDDRYPQDRARGYKSGDFLGMVSVVVPEDQAR